ncbi:MAG: hypothetical protein JNL02_18835 [Saprospiraceae bacterium]|nr:hypothetical protein [Saprospiraceae bacterium]
MTEIEEKLNLIYQHATDMIKFAEAKNAGLIAFNGAVIVGMVALLKDVYNIKWLAGYLIFVIIMNLVSLFLAMTALTALILFRERKPVHLPGDNLQFFGTIADYDPELFYRRFCEKYKLAPEKESFELDLARQTVIVSQIALRKFRLFNLALLWTFAGVATPVSVLVFKLFYNPSDSYYFAARKMRKTRKIKPQ